MTFESSAQPNAPFASLVIKNAVPGHRGDGWVPIGPGEKILVEVNWGMSEEKHGQGSFDGVPPGQRVGLQVLWATEDGILLNDEERPWVVAGRGGVDTLSASTNDMSKIKNPFGCNSPKEDTSICSEIAKLVKISERMEALTLELVKKQRIAVPAFRAPGTVKTIDPLSFGGQQIGAVLRVMRYVKGCSH